jgi:Protein of unknown function (DUF1549)/Protein of unknown function (DUF1553)
MRTIHLSALAALFVSASLAQAQQLLPPDRPISEAIDHYIDAVLKEQAIKPASQADDTTLIRRLTLDLLGRIPTTHEVHEYVTSTDPEKRTKLIDRLLASPGFVRHQVNEFDSFLMTGRNGESLRGYLTLAFKDNRGWDRIFRELMSARDTDPGTKGSSVFLKQNVKDLDRLTSQVSSLFFGVNVSCAQCHDHPLVHDWKQDHYYGMKSFFARTYEMGAILAERDYGSVQFKTTKGETRQAQMMFLNGTIINDPVKLSDEEIKKREKTDKPKRGKKGDSDGPPPAAPKFSARAALADLALQPKQRDFFARSIVNRLWYRFTGTGLVSPLDQMHSENAPSHPELLAWMARDMADHNYDLKRVIRGVVLSKTYSRSSRWEGAEFPRPQTYAVARLRPLTPDQMATSLRFAVTAPTQFAPTVKPEEIEKRFEGLENSARGYAALFEKPTDDFQIGVSEALLFSNGERMRELLGDGGDRLVGQFKDVKEKDVDAVIDGLVQNVLCRPARGDERAALVEYFHRRKDRPNEAVRQMTWALLASPEFRFNH